MCSNNKLLISLYKYQLQLQVYVDWVLWTGLTDYTQQECTYLALALHQPSYKQMYNSRVLQTVWNSSNNWVRFLISHGFQLQLQVWVNYCEHVKYNEASLITNLNLLCCSLNCTYDTENIPQILSNILIANKLDSFSNFLPCWRRTNSW